MFSLLSVHTKIKFITPAKGNSAYKDSAKRITNEFVISTKKAATKGKIMNAKGAGPCDFVTAVMFAIAVGVAPKAKPPNPALSTAA